MFQYQMIPALDPAWLEGGGGARNMKYKGPSMAAIFFMTSFNKDGGGMAPWPPPPDPKLDSSTIN